MFTNSDIESKAVIKEVLQEKSNTMKPIQKRHHLMGFFFSFIKIGLFAFKLNLQLEMGKRCKN